MNRSDQFPLFFLPACRLGWQRLLVPALRGRLAHAVANAAPIVSAFAAGMEIAPRAGNRT